MLCSYDSQNLILPDKKGHSHETEYAEDNSELEKASKSSPRIKGCTMWNLHLPVILNWPYKAAK